MDGDANERGLIHDKGTQLKECPAMERGALRPSNPHPRTNMLEILKCDRPLRAFGRRHNPFTQDMIHIGGKPSFLTGELPQTTAGALGAFALELVPQAPVAIANVLERLAW